MHGRVGCEIPALLAIHASYRPQIDLLARYSSKLTLSAHQIPPLLGIWAPQSLLNPLNTTFLPTTSSVGSI